MPRRVIEARLGVLEQELAKVECLAAANELPDALMSAAACRSG